MGNKLSEPIKVGNLTFKNRIMFPPLTTGYEERDGSIGERSLNFYERLAKGGAAYVVIGDVAPVRTASPTPKLYDDSQIPVYKNLADTLHKYDCKLALQLFHPEYDVPGVGRMIMEAGIARQAAAKARYRSIRSPDSFFNLYLLNYIFGSINEKRADEQDDT